MARGRGIALAPTREDDIGATTRYFAARTRHVLRPFGCPMYSAGRRADPCTKGGQGSCDGSELLPLFRAAPELECATVRPDDEARHVWGPPHLGSCPARSSQTTRCLHSTTPQRRFAAARGCSAATQHAEHRLASSVGGIPYCTICCKYVRQVAGQPSPALPPSS